VLDIGLPVMDGFELGRRLRAVPGLDVRLVALTGYGRAVDRERSSDAGFQAHLVKPVELDALAAALFNGEARA
jgi:CheY-like chemotaxis protein